MADAHLSGPVSHVEDLEARAEKHKLLTTIEMARGGNIAAREWLLQQGWPIKEYPTPIQDAKGDTKESHGELQEQANLICEALMREIEHAERWQTVQNAWGAILTVRRLERWLTEEKAAQEGPELPPDKVGNA